MQIGIVWLLSGIVVALAPSAAAQQPQMPMGHMGQGHGMGQGMGPGMMMGQGGMMHGPMMSQHTEGYLAFLKAELGITAAQQTVWEGFAKAVRERASKMANAPTGMMGHGTMMGRGTMMGPNMMTGTQATSLPDSLDRQIAWAQSRMEMLAAIRDAAKPLYETLSAEQRAKADALIGCPMCLL